VACIMLITDMVSLIKWIQWLDGTIYWMFKTILNHSPEDDTRQPSYYSCQKMQCNTF
jgi:hypothetical protein